MLTSPADTLVCDTVQIAKWQSESAYDYNRELITPEINIFEWFRRQFGELLRKIFGSRFAEEYSELILIDTIYGVDFSGGIADALSRSDYREAVRLLYLQTLKRLSDEKRIDWQPYKTPTQYINEVRIPVFRQLTNHFLRVRYGNFEATEELFNSMKSLQEEIGKGGGS